MSEILIIYLSVLSSSLILSVIPFLSGAYLPPILSVVALPGIDPLTLGAFAGLGAATGRMSSYVIGRGTRDFVLEGRYTRKFEVMQRVFGRYLFAAVVAASATPLPDDFVFIPAGMMKYSAYKTFLGMLVGKAFLAISVAIGGSYVLSLLGLEAEATPLLGVLAAAVFAALVVVYLKSDLDLWLEKKLLGE